MSSNRNSRRLSDLEAITVPGRYLASAARVAARCGYKSLAWLEQSGLELGSLSRTESRVTTTEYQSAISILIRDSRLQALGLRVGLSENAADHGVVGHAMLCAPTMRDALEFFVEFQDITGPVVRLSSTRRRGNVVLTLVEAGVFGAAGLYEVENTFIALLVLLAGVGGKPTAVRLRLAYSDAGYASLYLEHFGCDVEFEQPRNEMWLAESTLERPSTLANAEFFELCRRQCEVIRAKVAPTGSLPVQVRRLMAASAGSFPSEERIAEALGISERTLRRHLAQEGTGFRRMLDEARVALAKELLRAPKRSIVEVASLVGYSSVHSFHRAFKRATSRTPAAYRGNLVD
ncbi:MAG: AraC family transcriptional regulator ligand-binding domain-containing protein [Proteobacteria bacterium]|nr:AraC family transcriptional regulator ligand-binding domain-containing protein [Pseudomonadota bacterium]